MEAAVLELRKALIWSEKWEDAVSLSMLFSLLFLPSFTKIVLFEGKYAVAFLSQFRGRFDVRKERILIWNLLNMKALFMDWFQQ